MFAAVYKLTMKARPGVGNLEPIPTPTSLRKVENAVKLSTNSCHYKSERQREQMKYQPNCPNLANTP